MKNKEKINDAIWDYFDNSWDKEDFISEKMREMSDSEKEDLYEELKDMDLV